MKAYQFINEDCIKCKRVVKYMIRIGVFFMCKKCAAEEFNITKDYNVFSTVEQLDKYTEWLTVWKNRVKWSGSE
jgi:hypothetical protein